MQKMSMIILCLTVLAARLDAADPAPPPTRAQIEADWLLQDDQRGSGPQSANAVSPAEDAAGGVDGVKNGKWGFHTADEANPWWQVDLGQPTSLDRVVLFNRCDSMAERAAHLRVLLSDDGKDFHQAAENDGQTFMGFTDQQPLVLKLAGAQARYVRLTLPGKSYFHLDEVEIYAAGTGRNVALGQPAAQSSTSTWSRRHERPAAESTRVYPFETLIARGLKLAESQRLLGVNVDAAIADLNRIAADVRNLPANAADSAKRDLYNQVRWTIRRLALGNPLLSFDAILFVQRRPTMFPHMSDQNYGWWSRPGGGLCVLEGFQSDQPRVRCLTSDLPPGSVLGPDLSYDGKKALFAYCQYVPGVADMVKEDKAKVPAEAFYHIFEMNLDGSGRRQLTFGRYDDFDPRYLPSGEILFLSTRKGLALQSSPAFSDSTRNADLPDSYVRCGGDSVRPVPVYTMHAMRADGTNIRPLSSFENFEYTPSIASDGRILYTRWDYIDRFNGNYFSLWSANQDGTNPQLVYGNYTARPQVKCEARSVPNSSKLIMTASAHHSTTGGALCLLDRTRGTEFESPLKVLTPDVVFPETEGSPQHYYANPWPLSEDYFLVAWSDQRLPPHCRCTEEQNPSNAMGVYLFDAFGNQELLYRDAAISSMNPIPIAPRPMPPTQAPVVDWQTAAEGRFLVQDVYQGLDNIPRGSIKQLRVIGVPPKVQLTMNRPMLGISAEDPGKFVLGTVPVEADGSAHFRVPSGVPVFFQALDEDGLAVQTMRSLSYVLPNQTLACVGCHEHRDTAPPIRSRPPLAALREPSRLTPGPAGSWPLSFAQLVQPVLDRQCVECHGQDATAAGIDLRAGSAYAALMSYGENDLKQRAFERDRSLPGECTAANSKLWKLLTTPDGHQHRQLDVENRQRLATWMDTYAQQVGHYSEQQERDLARFRINLAPLLNEPTP